MLLGSIVLAVVSIQSAKPSPFGSFELITRSRLKSHLEFVAHDLLEGRDTPSRGQDIAAMYVATQLKLWGVKPGGEKGTYFQDLLLDQSFVNRAQTTLEVNGESVPLGKDWYALVSAGTVSAPVIYVGSGVVYAEGKINPYEGLDVKGKIVFVTGSQAGIPNDAVYTGKATPPAVAAAERGALAVINMESIEGFNYLAISEDFSRPGSPHLLRTSALPPIPSITVSPVLAEKILGMSRSAVLRLPSVSQSFTKANSITTTHPVSLKVGVLKRSVLAKNVIGIVPGTDPKLKAEFVGFGAHIDHVGVDRNLTGDAIFNGADDDGSGTVALLEMAYAFAAGRRPKRSMIFIWHTGEEKGLWGSAHYTANPTIPLKNMIAMLNIDMIGRSRPAGDTNPANQMLTGPNAIYVVGSRRISKALGDICESVNNGLYKIKYDFHYDKPNDPESIYERSDHYNYALKGIPIAFFFDGVHEDYHQVGDHVEKIDFQKLERVARTIYATGWTLGNRVQRP